uniref:PDZ domain-containing protein n=1 Tax=Ciona intestinalis TaxID=7719 RepID=H2XRV4_CIOIN
ESIEYRPRLCKIVKGDNGFGFHLLYLEDRNGEYIEDVTTNGAAEKAAGLKIGDRILEVNGVNIEKEKSRDVVERIRMSGSVVYLLVVDPKTDGFYRYKEFSISIFTLSAKRKRKSLLENILWKLLNSIFKFRNKPRLCRIFKDSDVFGFGIEYIAENDGHYITDVEPNGPAERAGLKVGDRAIQINGVNIDRRSHDDVLSRLRSCEGQVVLLVIDHKSAKHYKRISEFKQTTCSDDQRKGLMRAGEPRKCTIRKNDNEEHGFFLAIDRDRNGQIIRRVVKGGPADRAGLSDGDRILIVNNEPVETLDHEEVVSRIRECGNVITLTVIDERSDNFTNILFFSSFFLVFFKATQLGNKIGDMKKNEAVKTPEQKKKKVQHEVVLRKDRNEEGYGFHLAFSNSFSGDDNGLGGHVVHWVGKGGPADLAGVRDGDKIISVNGTNVVEEDHEQVMVRIHANGQNTVLL